MAGLRKKRRIQLIIAGLVLLVAATALMGYGFREGIELFRSPTQVAEDTPPPDRRFKIGGLVEEGSLVRGEGKEISFSVTDGGSTIDVRYTGVLPDLFREGQGVIASGYLRNGVFEAKDILAKHDENYMPREVADALKEQGVFKGD